MSGRLGSLGSLTPPDSGVSVRAKVIVLGGAVLLLFGILTVQLVRLQLLRHDEFVARAAINRVRTVDIAPARGLIYARDGTPLVEHLPTYEVSLIAGEIPDGMESAVAATLAGIFDIPAWELEELILQRLYSNDPFLPIPLADDVDNNVVFDLSSRRAQLPGLQIETVGQRRYPHGDLMGHIVGYVGPITQEEYDNLRSERYLYSDRIGRTGVEAAYEPLLRGASGRLQFEADAIGREQRVLSEEPATPGRNVVLTIDPAFQQQVEQILLDRIDASYYAAAVVLDATNGQVLASVSVPSYDYNIYSEDLDDAGWTALLEDQGRPLHNHAVSDQFPPGSIFKVITGAAALAEGIATPDTRIYSPGILEVHNQNSVGIIYEFGDTVQGVYNFRQAIAESSNVYFYYLAGGEPYRHPDALPRPEAEQEALDALAADGVIAGDTTFHGVGPTVLGHWARQFGLDSETGIDLAGEASGLIPTTQQKLEAIGEPWLDGDTYNMAIGQGFTTVTPLQMAVATAAIANGGTVFEPRVVMEVRDAAGNVIQPYQPVIRRQIEIDPEVLRVIREGMALCVLAGTCHDAQVQIPDMMIAGKTGTAEFAQTGPAISGAEEGETHGWFIAFAPFDDPQIAIAVFFEFSAGYLAAAAGGEILKAWAEWSGAINGGRRPAPLRPHRHHPRRGPAPLRRYPRALPMSLRAVDGGEGGSGRSVAGHSWRYFDPLLVVVALALAGYGALIIYSATLPRGAETIIISTPVQRHITFALIGAALMFVTARVDYRLIDALGWLAYAFGLAVLVAVLFLGSSEFGARRWFDLGFTVVQASEIGKLMTIIGLAKFLTDYRDRLGEWRMFAASLLIVAVPAGLVAIEPDAGSAIVFMALWFVMTAFAGMRLRHFAMLGLGLVLMIPVGLAAGIQDYQRDRIRAFIDPGFDPQGAGFNVIQAETAVGAGGLWGQGLTEGAQTQLDFVRIQTTDFVFSALSEELGFIGAMALFALFLLLLFRILRVVAKAPEPLGRSLAVGLLTVIAVQVFINVAINIRLLPVTGLPLPFISIGNSGLLTLFIGLGLLQSVLLHQDDARGRTPDP